MCQTYLVHKSFFFFISSKEKNSLILLFLNFIKNKGFFQVKYFKDINV